MIILRNAYVFTFNKNQDFGRYSILIKENRITDMVRIQEADDEKENTKVLKWIELYGDRAEIIDCTLNIIMPPITNSCVKSEGSLIHYLLRNRHYESMEGDIYTDFIFNYIYQELQTDEMKTDIENIYNYSFAKNLKSGVTSFNELSLRNDTNHLNPVINALKKTGQKISLCYPIKQDANSIRDYKYLNPSYYLTNENLLTIYEISNITELRSHNVDRLFLEVAVNKEVTEKFKQTFQKPVIKYLDEYNLIDSNTSLINPLYLSYEEMKIIKEKNANIIICPRDLLYFTHKYFPVDDYISMGIKFTIGTGWLGEDIMKELRVFRNKYKELNISSSELLKSITSIPKDSYFNDNTEQSIDINKPADMIFVDLSDVRFQFFPENYDFENLCDFFIDNLASKDISGVMIAGIFKVRDNKPFGFDEEAIVMAANETRKRLYKVGKYEQLSERKKRKENIEKLDLRGRDDEEIKMFSDSTQDTEITEAKDEFRIKSRIPVFRHKTMQGQKNLFDNDNSPIVQSEDYQQTPMLNLLFTEIPETKNMEDEILQIKAIDEKIIKKQPASEKKAEKTKSSQADSKVELPKNVKLKFGDD